jgi:recombinational DNA repair protein (RecF pathway)
MRWSQSGWFLGAKKWSGSGSIASVLVRERGLWKGLLRSKPPLLGSYVNVQWSAKDISSLGSMKIEEVDTTIGIKIIQNPGLARTMVAMCEVVMQWCGERDPSVYELFDVYIRQISEKPEYLAGFLAAVLKQSWGCDVKPDLGSISRAAYQLQLRRLPLCYSMLKGVGV